MCRQQKVLYNRRVTALMNKLKKVLAYPAESKHGCISTFPATDWHNVGWFSYHGRQITSSLDWPSGTVAGEGFLWMVMIPCLSE
jgi:hypothetical protein